MRYKRSCFSVCYLIQLSSLTDVYLTGKLIYIRKLTYIGSSLSNSRTDSG